MSSSKRSAAGGKNNFASLTPLRENTKASPFIRKTLRVLSPANGTGVRQSMMKTKLTAIIRSEEDAYVALTPELDIASQGGTSKEALDNLREAVNLFFETASMEEIKKRLSGESTITQFEADYATA